MIQSVYVDTVFSVQVAARQANGSTDTTYTGNITLLLKDQESGAPVLSGTLTKAAVAGVATFDDLEIDQVSNGNVLLARSSGFREIESNPFSVVTALIPGPTLYYMALVLENPYQVDEEVSVVVIVSSTPIDFEAEVPYTPVDGVQLSLSSDPTGPTIEASETGSDTTGFFSPGIANFTFVSDDNDGGEYEISAMDITNSFNTGPIGTVVIEPAREVEVEEGNTDTVYALALEDYADAGTAEKKYLVTVTGDVLSLEFGTGFPVGATFELVNEADVMGAGGKGGDTTLPGLGNPDDGEDGGPAVEINGYTVRVRNADGRLLGGGGGGAGAGAYEIGGPIGFDPSVGCVGAPGSGGQGPNNAAGGVRKIETGAYQSAGAGLEVPINDALGTVTDGTKSATLATGIVGPGAAGSISGPGAAGNANTGSFDDPDNSSTGTGSTGVGARGGEWGMPGEDGPDGEADTTGSGIGFQTNGASGGAGGKAISLSGGTVIWLSGNSPDRVKGAVS